MTHLDTTLSALDTLGYRVVLDANPYGHEDCYMDQHMQTTDVTMKAPQLADGVISHNGIGLPTQERHPATPQPAADSFHELVCIFQRSLNNGDDMTTRPHKITLHMSGVDLIRLVQLAMYPTGERK